MEQDKIDEFYKGFREKLIESNTLPGLYTFKFIIPSDEHKIAQVLQVFEESEPTISYKESTKGTYTSVSIQLFQIDADSVIAYYKEIGLIEGVMML